MQFYSLSNLLKLSYLENELTASNIEIAPNARITNKSTATTTATAMSEYLPFLSFMAHSGKSTR